MSTTVNTQQQGTANLVFAPDFLLKYSKSLLKGVMLRFHDTNGMNPSEVHPVLKIIGVQTLLLQKFCEAVTNFHVDLFRQNMGHSQYKIELNVFLDSIFLIFIEHCSLVPKHEVQQQRKP